MPLITDYALPNYPPSADVSFGTLVTNNSSAIKSFLKAVHVTNVNAAVRYLQFFNTLTATGTPVFSFPVSAGTAAAPGSLQLSGAYFGNGFLFSAALTWGISTSAATYVAATAADHTLNLLYM